MKKICLFLILAVLATALFSCGNYGMGLGNYSYTKIHIDTYHFSGCYTVEKWYESESGIEVTTKELGSIFASEGTYILVEDKCPVCDAHIGE
jgi:hypothetical protein